MAAFNQVLYMTSLVNSLHHLVVQGGAGWLNLNFTWCLFNVLVINYTKSSKKKKRKEERCHGRLYLTSGVPQEVTYMRNNFIESQALGSISVRQTDQSNEQREKKRGDGRTQIFKNEVTWRPNRPARAERAKEGNSRVQRGDETKAHSFSGPVVFMLEASQHSVPHVLQKYTTSCTQWNRTFSSFWLQGANSCGCKKIICL